MQNFTTVGDEAIHYRLKRSAPIRVSAVVHLASPDGDLSVMFVHQVGKGRVFFSPFGDNEHARSNPAVQLMILRATEWAATGAVNETR